MKEITELLKATPYGCLATVENGLPRVRPFGFMFEEEGKLYFCTNNTKDVSRQLKEVPFVEYSATTNDMVTLRLNGRVLFSEDMDKKQKALEASELVKSLYKSADNPIFEVFYMEHGKATISDFSGQPPRKIEF